MMRSPVPRCLSRVHYICLFIGARRVDLWIWYRRRYEQGQLEEAFTVPSPRSAITTWSPHNSRTSTLNPDPQD
jgi:hypothetical protein